MKRRNALKNIGLFSGGLLLFPSCDFSDEKVSIILNKLNINTKQESLLKSIVDTMLPEGDIPGGIFTKSHNFVWAIIDDCTSKEDQNNFIKGLNEFALQSKNKLGENFVDANEKDRLQSLKDLMLNKKKKDTIKAFLDTTKKLAVWCYMNSEYIMTEEMPYKLVPGAGSYVKCKTIDPNKKININA